MDTRRDRLLSGSLAAGWAIPFTLLALPLFRFGVEDRPWMIVAIVTALVAIWLCFSSEHARTPVVGAAPRLPSPRQCRKAVYLFSTLTVVGAVLILIDQQGTIGLDSITNLQQRYIEQILASQDGGPLGTWISTVGTILRSTIYVAIVAMVALSSQSRSPWRNGMAWAAIAFAIAASEIATASRTLVVFCVTIAVIAGFAVRHPFLRRLGTLFALGCVAVILFAVTTQQRFEASGGEEGFALAVIQKLFDVDLDWMGQWVADHAGFPIVTGLLYLSHSVPEFSRLVADNSSQVALGGHSLYLVIAPLERMVGMEAGTPANFLAQRPGMWWGALGDLYLDFGIAFVVMFPALVVALTRMANSLRSNDVFSLTFRCMTAAIFFCSPYFGVLNAFSFTYLMVIGLALLHVTLRRRPAIELRHPPGIQTA